MKRDQIKTDLIRQLDKAHNQLKLFTLNKAVKAMPEELKGRIAFLRGYSSAILKLEGLQKTGEDWALAKRLSIIYKAEKR